MTHTQHIPPRHLLILFLFASLLLLPTVLFGAGGYDALVNCMKMRMFANQFWHGDLYPRWLQDHFAGNGSAMFFYYPPLAYFITSFFIFLSPLDAFGFYPIAASVWLAAFISGIAFYRWMKDEAQENRAALLGSLLYMSAPNVIGLDFNYSALFPTVWAYAFVPLLMMYAKRIAELRPYALVGFATTLGALIMTNIPMTILFGPLAAAYSALYFRKHAIIRQVLTLGIATVLGFALSATLLIPAAAYLDYSNAKMFWTAEAMDYHHYLVLLGFSYLNQIVYTLAILIMAALTLLYLVALRDRPKKYLFFCAASFIGLFMILHASVRIWEAVPVLKMLQFPERFFMLPSLCLAVLATVAGPRLRWLAYILIVGYSVSIFVLGTLDTRITEDGLRKYNHLKYEKYVLGIDFPGLLPSADLLSQYSTRENLAELDKPHPKIETIHGEATAEVVQWLPRDITLRYKATQPSQLRLWQFYFPGHTAFEGETVLPLTRDTTTGQVLIDVPPGEGEVHLKLTQLMPEMAGKMISLLSAGVLLLCFLAEFRRHREI